MEETLQEHVRLQGRQGRSQKDVQRLLEEAGWPKEVVAKYVAESFKDLPKGALISAHAVTKAFGQNQVLRGVDLEIQRGEIFGLIGVSGAGKTTLLGVMVGFIRPDAGDVLVGLPDGSSVSVQKSPERVKRLIGFSTQTPSFYPKLTVRENISHFAKLYGLADADIQRKSAALMELVGLGAARDVQAFRLSGGMQKRLDIACALVHDPELLILDEPTADLDPILRKQLWELIRKINAKGTTILLASHFLAEIELLCSRIAILQQGRVVEMGTADELRGIYSKNYEIFIQTRRKDYRALLAKGRKYFFRVEEDDGELVVQTPFPERVLSLVADVVSRGDLVSLHISRPTLGRVFEAVVKR